MTGIDEVCVVRAGHGSRGRNTTWALVVAALLAATLTVAAGTTPTPVAAEGSGTPAAPAGYRQLAMGTQHACGIDQQGRVKCWGANGNGRLGLGDNLARGDAAGELGDDLPTVALGTGRTAVAISAGNTHTCALLDNGQVKCWGGNGSGRLGLGDTAARGDAAGEMGDDLAPVALGPGRTATAVVAAGSHTCALLDNGQVKCWGNNSTGQLGLGDTADRGDAAGEMGANLPAVDLGTGQRATAVTAGTGFSCALLATGKVKCWGNNASGELGYGDNAARGDGLGEMGNVLAGVDLGAGRTVESLASGDTHTCAVLDDRTLKCWGDNGSGQLGLGDTADRGDGPGEMGDSLPAIALGTGRSVTAVAAGAAHTCALLDNTAVKCWGNNAAGQLGHGNTTTRGDGAGEMGDTLITTSVGTGRTPMAIDAGGSSSCVRLDDTRIKCWGDNGSGQLGLGDTADRGDTGGEMGDALPPVDLAARRAVLDIDAGDTTCALLDGGLVRCWGNNAAGQLGQGDTAHRGDAPGEVGDALPAVPLGSGERARQISASDTHACALLTDGRVKCWGDNATGQLGLGDTANRGDGPGEMGDALPAVDLGTGRTATVVSVGNEHSCAVLDNGQVKCWGENTFGQLGLGDTVIRGDAAGEMGDALPAVDLGTGRTATTVVAGNINTCAILDDASLKCWGFNGNGRLGLGDTANRGDGPGEMGNALPTVDLGTGRTVTEVGMAWQHLCARLDNATVKCWGFNGGGELGLGDTVARGANPGDMGNALPAVNLGAGRTVTSLAVAEEGFHTCATLDNGALKCWGNGNAGQLGLGSSAVVGKLPGDMGDNLPAVDLGTGRRAVVTDTGDATSCAILDDGTVKCWGGNVDGQLGLGDIDARGNAPGEMGNALPRSGTGSEAPVGVGGTVTAAGSGKPIGGAFVAVLRTTDFAIAGGTVADPGGNYVAEVPPGTYFVYVIDAEGRHTSGFFGTPTTRTVDAVGAVDTDPALARLRGAITGTITDQTSGDPLTDAWGLTLTTSGVPGTADPVDSAGQFTVPDLVPGDHYVAYVDGTGQRTTEFFQDSPNVPDATPVPVTAGAATNRNAALATQTATSTGAVLNGRVSADGGMPIPDALVIAMHAADFRLARIAATDANGLYELDLAAGSYKLVFFDAAGRHAMEWFENQPYFAIGDAGNATAPGTVNASLTPTGGTISGTVTDATSGSPLPGAWVVAIAPNGTLTGTPTAADGTYTISGLAPGAYRITFADPAGGRAQEYFDDSPDYFGGTDLNVTAGSTTSGIDAALP
ncbi:MAG TPA: carboxypeptidase regulatory-like domain-containing protein [Acidimicrobiales bacterium]|nr:carboxypeptidase regulatory-like domain-containing protein [Acidimicrobiales bacterium]